MDIKLRARLSAYSKIESLEGLQNNIPVPDTGDYGSVLGVGDTGKYTLFPRISQEDMDSQLGTIGAPDTVTKDSIDNLFVTQEEPTAIDKATIDTLFGKEEEPEAVDKSTIDTLFTSTDEPDAVDKEEIDTLFKKEPTETIGTVSYAEIDSLFK